MGRNLILCFDGTWNTEKNRDGDELAPTNVVLFHEMIVPGPDQITWYDPGVGTHWYDRLRGGLIGEGLGHNVRQGYRWLSGHYEPDDQIFLFGFSRGAFTARSLGGLIRKCGLLKRGREDQVDAAYGLYKDRKIGVDDPAAAQFRTAHSQAVKIRFIGVWDTVGALGIPIRLFKGLNEEEYGFHDTELSGIVENGYHALAIDEHREQFEPSLWKEVAKPGQTIEQRWFAGAHSNIGGGYRSELPESGGTERVRLADLSLAWMARAASGAGLTLRPFVVNGNTYLGPVRDSYAEFIGVLGFIYRWLDRKYYRPITPAISPSQRIDPSVDQRVKAGINYHPKNLSPLLPFRPEFLGV